MPGRSRRAAWPRSSAAARPCCATPVWRGADCGRRRWRRAGAAATLSIGVLAVLLAAGLASALLLRPVSTRHGETLRRVAVVDASGRAGFRLSFLEAERVGEHIEGRARHALVNLQPTVLRAEGADLQTMIEVVDGGYFELIGAPIILGRALVSADDRPSAPPVVVIGEAMWRRRFGANPTVIGRTVSLNRAAFTVVGITAAAGSASALGAGVDAWTPLAHADAVLNPGWRTDPQARWFSLFALPSTSAADLDAGLALAARELAARQPEAWRDRRLRSEPGTVLTGGQRSAVASVVWILGGLAALILAAGAANVGGGADRPGLGLGAADRDPSGARRRPRGDRPAAGDRGSAVGLRRRRPGVAGLRVGAPASRRGRAPADPVAASRAAARRLVRADRAARRGRDRRGAGDWPGVLGDARRCRGRRRRRRAARRGRRHGVADAAPAGLGASRRVVDPGGRRGAVLAQPRVARDGGSRLPAARPGRPRLRPGTSRQRRGGGDAGPRGARSRGHAPGRCGRGHVEPRAGRSVAPGRGGAARSLGRGGGRDDAVAGHRGLLRDRRRPVARRTDVHARRVRAR